MDDETPPVELLLAHISDKGTYLSRFGGRLGDFAWRGHDPNEDTWEPSWRTPLRWVMAECSWRLSDRRRKQINRKFYREHP